MAKLIQAHDTRTGELRSVPENWFDHPQLSVHLAKGKPPAELAAEPTAEAPPPKPKNSKPGETKTPPAGENEGA